MSMASPPLLSTSSISWYVVQWRWKNRYCHVKYRRLRNLIGWERIRSSGLFVGGYRYESRIKVEPGHWQGGGPVVYILYCVIEGIMGSIPTGSFQRQVCWANFVIWAILTSALSTPSFVLLFYSSAWMQPLCIYTHSILKLRYGVGLVQMY
jgi:hypothetical protein